MPNANGAKPTKREQEIQKYLRKKRFAQKREEADKEFPFTPDPHPDVIDYSRDAKRIRKSLELDDVTCQLAWDMYPLIEIMMMVAGYPTDERMPADTKFLYALQRAHDYHHERTIPTRGEWTRVNQVQVLASYVHEVLNVIDEERQAGWPGRNPKSNWRRKKLAA